MTHHLFTFEGIVIRVYFSHLIKVISGTISVASLFANWYLDPSHTH